MEMSGVSKRGFASMEKDKLKEICKKGGAAAHLQGTAHEFTKEEAKIAGKKGGLMKAHNRKLKLLLSQ